MSLNQSSRWLSAASLLCLAAPAWARATPPTDQQPTVEVGAAVAGDIIVTAQRRDERLSRTPVAVLVVTGDTLAKSQIVSEQDLRSAAPGLSVRASLSSEQLNYALRGQSQDALSGTRPGVLPYINDIQIAGSGGTAFYDLQSVQVLKGPQGTLFGRSGTGGAVLFNTVKPGNSLGGYVDGSLGNYNAYKIEGALNLPLIGDTLLARFAGYQQERDGFQRNLFNGKRVGKVNRLGLRGSLTAKLGDFRNDLVVDYYRSRGENTVASIGGLLPFTGGANPPYIPAQFLYAGLTSPTNPIPNATLVGQGTLLAFTQGPLLGALFGATPGTATPAQLATVSGIVNNAYNGYFAPGTGHSPDGLSGVLAAQMASGPYVVNSDAANVYRARNIIVSNTSTLQLSGDTRLKNIFGYVNIRSRPKYDTDGSPYSIAQNSVGGSTGCNCEDIEQISNELQLLGTTFNDRLSYVIGGYFSRDRSAVLTSSAFFDLLVAPFGLPFSPSVFDYTLTNTTFAGYTQSSYKLNNSGLAVTAGARYTSEKVRVQQRAGDLFVIANPLAPPGYSYDQAMSYNRLSWQVGLQNQFNARLLVYVVSRRAYKSGGFNGSVAPKVGDASVGGNAYDAERVTDVELGLKYQGTLGAMPTRFNVALFRNWVRNSQRTAFSLVNGGPSALTVNVPRSRVYGIELDAELRPASWLSIGGTGNYINTRYTDGNVLANGIPQLFDQVPDTPKYSGSLFTNVTVPVSNGLNFVARADVYAQSNTYTAPQSINNFGSVLPSYRLVNFRLGIEHGSAWSITANLKNAFDEVYYVGGVPAGNIFQINTVVPGDPRTFTLAARINF